MAWEGTLAVSTEARNQVIPRFFRVRQLLDQPEETDPAGAVARAIAGSRIRSRIQPGARVALAVGSRGIVGLGKLVRSAVDTLRAMGYEPFVVAGMGSHGGGTPTGQRALLAELGVSEETAGCPVSTSMETVTVGVNLFGLPIAFDAAAAAADGIVLLNRIKPHTSFRGRYESGLLKMLSVGLGKQQGAAQVHKLGLPGLVRLVPEVGSYLLLRMPVVLGLAVLENAREHTARVEGVEPEEFLTREPELLEEARGLMGRLPFEQIDVLVVGELGKNYSGTGLDPNVIGRQRVETMPDLPKPSVTRLVVLDVSAESCGNALGVGLADLITTRFRRAIDLEPMRVNSLTSNFLTRIRIPLDLPSDRAVLTAALDTCWRVDWKEARVVMIPSTLELETLYVSEAMRGEVEQHPQLHIERDADGLKWRASDPDRLDFPAMFPEAHLGRRERGMSH